VESNQIILNILDYEATNAYKAEGEFCKAVSTVLSWEG